jgi:hypothetical protein
MATPDPAPRERLYFLEIDGKQRGPYRLSELLGAGMERHSLVWWAGLESWVRAGSVPPLAALLAEQRHQLRAARLAERLPEPDHIRWAGRAVQLANVPTGALFFVGSTAFLTSLVLGVIASGSLARPPAPPDETLERVAIGLLFAGIGGSVLAGACLVAEAIFIGIFLWRCRAVTSAAGGTRSAHTPLPDLPAVFTWLGIGSALPFVVVILSAFLLFCGRGFVLIWRRGEYSLVGLVAPFALLPFMLVAVALCLVAPELVTLLKGVAILLTIYAVVDLPIVAVMLVTIYQVGYDLNEVIDRHRLKVPWAPIGLGFWTSLSAVLLMAGPLSLVPFALVAIWVHRTGRTAALICGDASARAIAAPLPAAEQAPAKDQPGFDVDDIPRAEAP